MTDTDALTSPESIRRALDAAPKVPYIGLCPEGGQKHIDISSIPHTSGVYAFFDDPTRTFFYVGSAPSGSDGVFGRLQGQRTP